MSEWKTIDSAPKDGTAILGFDPQLFQRKGGVVVMCWMKPGWAGAEHEGWVESGLMRPRPTYWQPLPAPPSDNDAQVAGPMK